MSTIRKRRETGEIARVPTEAFASIVTLNAVGTFATITRFATDGGLRFAARRRGRPKARAASILRFQPPAN